MRDRIIRVVRFVLDRLQGKWPYVLSGVALFAVVLIFTIPLLPAVTSDVEAESMVTAPVEAPPPSIDKDEYDRRLRMLAHLPEGEDMVVVVDPTETDESVVATPPEPPPWPVTDAPYPEFGAILPFHRIVAYYGNFYSRGMGVLGEYDTEVMLEKLDGEIATWEAADPETPVMPAIDYIAVVAQAGAGADGKYRLRMPDKEIDKALALAERIDGIVFLEVQSGLADVMDDVRSLETYLALPNVHLALDPEFAMVPSGRPPGTVVGTVDASQVNEVADYLASLVQEHDLPPKILMVHRYTRYMLTNATDIMPLPEVQVIIDMDGWGPPSQKIASYESYVASEPVQFTGFKLFYKNDRKREGSRLLTPAEILDLTPQPIFIQYQ